MPGREARQAKTRSEACPSIRAGTAAHPGLLRRLALTLAHEISAGYGPPATSERAFGRDEGLPASA